MLTGALAGAAGMLLSMGIGTATADLATSYTVRGLTVAVIGGLGSIPGAIAGGLLVGVVEFEALRFLGIGYRDVFAYLALFTAFGFALARLVWTKGGSRVFGLAASLTISEWLRGHVLTGFPWNAFGYALTEPLALAQTASLIGLWGLTFLAVAIFGVIVWALWRG